MEDFHEIELTLEQRQRLETAFLNAFDPNDLSQMLRLKMGLKIAEELNINRGLRFIVTDLIDISIKGGWIRRLLLSAKDYRPGNTRIQAIVGELHISQPERINKENIELEKDIHENQGFLEKIVRKRAPFIPFDSYVKGLSAIGKQIARIEIPRGTEAGTGWLVGPNLVLTAYHVVEKIHKNEHGFDFTDLVVRFDYTVVNGLSRTCAVKENWLIDYAPYSEKDLQLSLQDPAANELDYALLELVENAGNEAFPDGSNRGWIEIHEYPVVMSIDDFVMIPQHPDGRPLELAFGALQKYNNAANRIRYDTNTEPGSSGSPCFNIGLQPFAMHQASGPAKNLVYNQGVPLREIIKLMKTRNIKSFWKKTS